MTPEDFQRVRDLFAAVWDLPPEEREERLDDACADRPDLRSEVESLIAHREDPQNRLLAQSHCQVPRKFIEHALGAADAEEPLPKTIGRYRIIERIGEGGMGTVYLAEQDHPHRRVALKMIRPGYLSRSMLHRFNFEADILGRLQHPGIAQIHEAGEIDTDAGRQPYFAMEYVDGVELQRYARERGLGNRAKMELVARICDAVHHAHQKGVIHRDLKPENVLVVEEPDSTAATRSGRFANLGQPKVLDFGVARATDRDIQVTTLKTDVGQLIGTIPYMSPEQVVGDSRELDTRSDVYALGVILFELLSGQLPFDLRQKPIPEAARLIREDDPTRLSSIDPVFRGDIETIVSKALEKDRDRRYQSAAELAADIRRHLVNEPLTAHPPSTFYQIRKFARRNTGLVAGLALSFLIMIGGTIVSLIYASLAQQRENLAEANEERAVRAAGRGNLAAAQAVGRTDAGMALVYLDHVPEAHRNWEWRYLHAMVNPEAASYAGNPSPEAAREDEWPPPGDFSSNVTCRPDGRLIAALPRGDRIELIDLESGVVTASVDGETELSAPSLSRDGSRLAAFSSATETLVIWDVDSAQRVLELPIGTVNPSRVRFSPDGELIALPSLTQGASLLEVDTGRVMLAALPHKEAEVTAVAFDASGQRLAVAGRRADRDFFVRMFSVEGEELALSGATEERIFSMAFSPDGERLAVGHEWQKIRILDATTLEESDRLSAARAASVLAFSPDGACLAGSCFDGGAVRVWDLARPELYVELCAGPTSSLAFGPDNTYIAGGSTAGVKLWEWRRASPLVLHGHEGYVYFVAFSPDGSMVASAAWDGTVRLWDALTGEPIATLANEDSDWWCALDFTPDGSCLIACDNVHCLVQWDIATGVMIDRVEDPVDTSEGSNWLRYARAARGGARSVPVQGTRNPITNSDGSLLARFTEHGEIIVVRMDDGREALRISQPRSKFTGGTFSRDGARLLSGSTTGVLTVWDAVTGAEVASMSGHSGRIHAITGSPDGTRIASGADDGKIILWDAQTFERIITLSGHQSYVHSLRFSPDGTQLASASGDGTVRLWDSVPLAERRAQARTADALREEAAPRVDRLLDDLGDPLKVADRLRGDDTLDESLRCAALRVLLQRSQSPD